MEKEVWTLDELKELFKTNELSQIETVLTVADFIGDWRVHNLVKRIRNKKKRFSMIDASDMHTWLFYFKSCSNNDRVKRICNCIVNYFNNYILCNDSAVQKWYSRLKEEVINEEPLYKPREYVDTHCTYDRFGMVQSVFHTLETDMIRIN